MDHPSTQGDNHVDDEEEHSSNKREDNENEYSDEDKNEAESEVENADESESDIEEYHDSDDGGSMDGFREMPTGVDCLPKHIEHYEEIKHFTIREGCNVTLQNVAELWPNLKIPSVQRISDDTIDKYFEFMVYDEYSQRSEWYALWDQYRWQPPLIVKMATARQVFEAADELTLWDIPTRGFYSSRGIDHYWPYIQDDKWLLVRKFDDVFSSDLCFTHHGNLGWDEARLCLKNLQSFYRSHGVKIYNHFLQEIDEYEDDDFFHYFYYNQVQHDESDPGLQLLIQTRRKVKGNYCSSLREHLVDRKLVMFIELLSGDHHARMHLKQSVSAKNCVQLINALEQRLVQQYPEHGPLGKNNLKLLREIADEHQADPEKKDYGLSLAKTVVVLSHWSAGKYKNFLSTQGMLP